MRKLTQKKNQQNYLKTNKNVTFFLISSMVRHSGVVVSMFTSDLQGWGLIPASAVSGVCTFSLWLWGFLFQSKEMCMLIGILGSDSCSHLTGVEAVVFAV